MPCLCPIAYSINCLCHSMPYTSHSYISNCCSLNSGHHDNIHLNKQHHVKQHGWKDNCALGILKQITLFYLVEILLTFFLCGIYLVWFTCFSIGSVILKIVVISMVSCDIEKKYLQQIFMISKRKFFDETSV